MNDFNYDRSMCGVARLYGIEGAEALKSARFVVVGVGGVGSWACEALVRSGAHDVTLIDADTVAESNTNRQLQATTANVGKSKIAALAERFATINPLAKITLVEKFVDEENVVELVGENCVVLDCIDQVKAKAALIAHCRKTGSFVVTSGAAGGRINPCFVTTGDLAKVTCDPLLSNVRHRLRKQYGFPKASSKPKPFGVPAVTSSEPVAAARDAESLESASRGGWGSGVVVTSVFGMNMAALAINHVIGRK